jgi:hypothetical protein
MAVTRTDSERAAAFGIGRPSSVVEDSTPALPSNRSLKKKASTTSQLSTTESHIDDEHGIPEIGLQVPMYPNAGDVQAPSPSPAIAEPAKGRHHVRRASSRNGNLPPGSYGLHGHGVVSQDRLDKAYYDKHPDLLKKEHVPHHYDRPNDFSMSSDDLNKIVRDTASHGSGLGKFGQRSSLGSPLLTTHHHTAVKNYPGTPSDQVAWQAIDESTSRVVTPGPSSPDSKDPTKPGSTVSDSDKESRRPSAIGDVIHVDEPSRRRSVMFSDTESVNAGEELERPYTAPILADDEVAKDPSPGIHHPAVEPPLEYEEPASRPTSRPASLYKETSFELRPTPLEDVEEYEPLFKDDEKPEPKKPVKEEKPKSNHKHRFPSADIWEDAPSSVFYTAEVSTPELFDEQEKPSPAVIPPPREGETPAQAFARHQEELAEKEAREHGPEGFIPARNKQKPLWAQSQPHLAAKMVNARPSSGQRFPSRDVWEDTPDSLKLETTVSTPQQDDVSSPADTIKPDIPERAQAKSPAAGDKPAVPERPRPRQASGDDKDKPAIPERPKPKPQIPARPAKAGPTSGGLEPAEAAAPPPRQKPAVPVRPMGSKIAALQAGFMNDLNRRLQLGPQAPPKREAAVAEDEQSEEKEKEKVPLSDARKGRARGPQRRAPASAAAAAAAAASTPASSEASSTRVPTFGFATAMSLFEIDPDDGMLKFDGSGQAKAQEKETLETRAEAGADTEAPVVEQQEEAGGAGEAENAESADTKVETEPEPKPKSESRAEAEHEETKTLATNLAGEPLVEEQVKKDDKHLTVEPVKVEEY